MALRPIRFDVALLSEGTAEDTADSRKIMLFMLELLALYDLKYLRRHPNTVRLAKSGVRYVRDTFPDDLESWKGIPAILRDGHADCKSLAAWRCAELRLAGKKCKMALTFGRKSPTGRGTILHAIVERADGTTEDPSRLLGM